MPLCAVGPGVLIPRPETELMIDFVQGAVAANPALASGAWADLGTGSGALAVGVARALPQAQQVGRLAMQHGQQHGTVVGFLWQGGLGMHKALKQT